MAIAAQKVRGSSSRPADSLRATERDVFHHVGCGRKRILSVLIRRVSDYGVSEIGERNRRIDPIVVKISYDYLQFLRFSRRYRFTIHSCVHCPDTGNSEAE